MKDYIPTSCISSSAVSCEERTNKRNVLVPARTVPNNSSTLNYAKYPGCILICCHKCFCIEMCFAFLAAVLSVRQSGFRGLPQDMAVSSRCRRRDSSKNVNIKKYHRLVRFFADKYDVAKPI